MADLTEPNQTELKRVGTNVIKVTGPLDVTTVAHTRDAGIQLIDEIDAPEVDLSDARVAGSAAVALLIAWLRHAARTGKQMRYTHPPANLKDITRACGVDDIIPIVS